MSLTNSALGLQIMKEYIINQESASESSIANSLKAPKPDTLFQLRMLFLIMKQTLTA